MIASISLSLRALRPLCFILLCLPWSLRSAERDHPNILLICVDDLKPALGCYGDELAISPNIDRLAARGMRFDLAYCNQSVCAPSRNNLLLGSRSTSIGVYGLGMNFRRAVPDAVTMPQFFKNRGYHTAAIGKILHTGHGNHDDTNSWSVPSIPDKVVEYLDPKNSADGQLTREEAYFTNQKLGQIRSLPRGAAWELMDVPDNAYADGRIADEGIRRLQSYADTDQRFFLALGFVKPHLPLTAPKKYWDLHDPNKFQLAKDQVHPIDAPGFAGKRGGEIVNYSPLSAENLREDAMQRQLIRAYYACVSFMDAQIGRVLEELDRLKLSETTLIVLWGDHGWHLGDHGYWTKHTNYEQANRVPIIVVAPGVAMPGTSTRQLAETVDIFPTLAELAGFEQPTGPQPIDGISLIPVLRDSSARVRDHAYHCYPRGQRMGRAIRTDRYRMVEWKRLGEPDDNPIYELYDYENDPMEKRNWADSKPSVVADLLAVLNEHPAAEPRAGR